MFFIESKNNALFKETKKLKDRKGRNKASKYIIEGFRLVEEALKARVDIEYIFIESDEMEKFNNCLLKFHRDYVNSIKIYEISKNLNKELSSTENPQGVTAVINMNTSKFNYNGSFYILCDKVQDPGNLGTIIRTSHAAGVDGIILTKGTVDVYNDKTLRSTMGSIFYIPIIYDDDNFSIIKSFKEKNYDIVATSLQAENDFFNENLKGNTIIVVGNEGNGVTSDIYNLSNKKVKIPMPGGAESLNVSVATSIIIYEKLRQSRGN